MDGVDVQLLERAKRFEPEALRDLHTQFYEKIYRYVHFKVGDPRTSEDLTSDVFVRVLEALKQGRGWHTTPSAWIFGIARNVVVDHYRKHKRRSEVELDEQLNLTLEDSLSQQVIISEQQDELAKAISSLTDEQRDVILMRFMEGLSISDVAEVLNKTPGAVKGLQHRAVRSLSEAMQHASSENVARRVIP